MRELAELIGDHNATNSAAAARSLNSPQASEAARFDK
jgi:hypothetical protein